MIAGTAYKPPCPYCEIPIHRGNQVRHERACLARIDRRRRRETAARLRAEVAA